MASKIKQHPRSNDCFACLSSCEEGFLILGTDTEFSAAALLQQHFWFRRDDFQQSQALCASCWNQLDSFHRFYLVVERNHPRESTAAAAAVKLEEKDEELLPLASPIAVKVEMREESSEASGFSDDGSDDDDEYKPGESPEEDEVPLSAKTEVKAVRQKRKYTKRKKSDDSPKKPVVSRAERAEQWVIKDNFIKTHVQFTCDQCVVDFPTFASFQKHMLNVHDIPKAPIMCCGKRFTRKYDLVMHVQREKDPSVFQCDVCMKNFTDPKGLTQHKEQMHGPDDLRPFACSRCPRRFPRESQLAYHLKGHENLDSGRFQCSFCQKRHPREALLNTHIKMHHTRPTDYICEVCAKGFYSKTEFARHKEEHELTPAELRKQCDICLTWFKNERFWLKHYKIHQEQPITCDVCGHVAPNKKAWAAHTKRVHAENKPSFVCDECGKEFRRAVNLKEHMVTHTGGGALYSCNFCPRTFNSNANMFSHRKKMHPQEWLDLKNSQYMT